MMNNNDLRLKSVAYDKSYALAIRIVKAYKYLKEHQQEFVLSKQLLRSGTSIGANVAEANGAISELEFSAKMSIAYKECLETFGFAESPFLRNVGTQRAFIGFLC